MSLIGIPGPHGVEWVDRCASWQEVLTAARQVFKCLEVGVAYRKGGKITQLMRAMEEFRDCAEFPFGNALRIEYKIVRTEDGEYIRFDGLHLTCWASGAGSVRSQDQLLTDARDVSQEAYWRLHRMAESMCPHKRNEVISDSARGWHERKCLDCGVHWAYDSSG